MVRRAGRSHACLTCLRRKKGCDQATPTCGQCRKAAIHCEGYVRPFVFKSALLPPAARLSPTAPPSDHHAIVLPESLTRSAYQTKVLDLFWRSYLPNGQALPREVAFISVGGWINTIQESQHSGDVLSKSLLALSLALVGRVDGVQWMSREGQRFYDSALHDMAGSFNTPRKPKGEKSLRAISTVRLLSLFEAMQIANLKARPSEDKHRPDQATRWQLHSTGECALIQINPPIYYASDQAHRIFADGRLHLITGALQTRKIIFLGEPKWKTIPWTGRKKTPKDHLVDILADVPTLFEQSDVHASSFRRDDSKIRQEFLIDICRDLESRLMKWHGEYHEAYEPLVRDQDSPEFQAAQALGPAHLLTLYWVTSLIVYTELRDLLGPDDEESLRAHMLSDLYCQNIVRIVPIFLRAATGMFRVHLATFPMAVIVRHFATAGSEGRLLKEKALMREYLMMPECASMRQLLASLKPQKTRSVLSVEKQNSVEADKVVENVAH